MFFRYLCLFASFTVSAITSKEEPAEDRHKVKCSEIVSATHTHRMTFYYRSSFREPVDHNIKKTSYYYAEHRSNDYEEYGDYRKNIHLIKAPSK